MRSQAFSLRGGFLVLAMALSASSLPAAALLVKNGLFLTMAPGAGEPFVGYMVVDDDGRIAKLVPGGPPADVAAERIVDAQGRIIAPGFVSAHSHLGSAPFRGLGHTETLYAWGLATQRLSRHSTADDVYWFSLFGACEFLRNGITTVFDFTNPGSVGGRAVGVGEKVAPVVLKPGTFNENQLRAKIDAGIRFINAVGLPQVGTREEVLARLEQLLAHAAREYGANPLFLKMAISGGVQRAPTKEAALLEAEAMRRFGLLNQSHFLESPERVPEQQAKFAWYVKADALSPNFIFGHFIHTTPDMIRQAVAAGAGMSWQPMSNGRLASGVADIVAYRAAGLRIGVGLDSNACTDTCDPFENMRTGLALIRAKYTDAKALAVGEMLHLHTLGSAELLGVADKVGSLEPGKFADFLVVNPRRPSTGPLHDPVATYVLACGLRNLEQVYVGGRLVADGVTLVNVDEAALLREIDARVARLQSMAATRETSGTTAP